MAYDQHPQPRAESNNCKTSFLRRVPVAGINSASSSKNTVLASSNETLCRRAFDAALCGSHSNRSGFTPTLYLHCNFHSKKGVGCTRKAVVPIALFFRYLDFV